MKGSAVSRAPLRTAAQAEIARFWYEGSLKAGTGSPASSPARAPSTAGSTPALFGLLNAAMADGYIAGADTRYLYNFWRPVTAHSERATQDGNEATAGRSHLGDLP